ncbi:MAG: hypothetical protein R3C44_14440 [Chloroflexota bacterium]
MFSLATRAGEQISICDLNMPGIDLDRPVNEVSDRFPASVIGWYFDGRQAHENYVKEKPY